MFATSGAKSGRTGRSTNPFISVQECVVVVKYIMVICVVVETLSFIRVRTDVQKHEPQIHKLMIICVVVEALSFNRIILIISICGVGTTTCYKLPSRASTSAAACFGDRVDAFRCGATAATMAPRLTSNTCAVL